ncbi:MAG: ribonuclease PH [Chloroflexi bacterium RBG_13_56_8]|nr:MAG: ribonuclease PH [Chloroflexi bacterium RBG_13_56_8]
MRNDGRAADALRPVTITPNYLDYADGSVLITVGNTKVLCAATIESTVPAWLEGRGSGWITGEYAMLPRATTTRTPRETRGLSGRTQEIRRLIGRALRASVYLKALGERSIILDCDVIQADGGTRTASITGGYVALALALRRLISEGMVDERVFRSPVAAVSTGIVKGETLLDLSYQEDAQAEVDANIAMNAAGEFVEVQGTAEGEPFPRESLDKLLSLAQHGIHQLIDLQLDALRD